MYSYNGQSFRGKDAIKQFLSQNESEREELMRKLREKLVGETNKEKESEAEAVDEDIAEGIVPPDTTDEEVTAVEAWKSKWPQVVPTFFTLAGYGTLPFFQSSGDTHGNIQWTQIDRSIWMACGLGSHSRHACGQVSKLLNDSLVSYIWES